MNGDGLVQDEKIEFTVMWEVGPHGPGSTVALKAHGGPSILTGPSRPTTVVAIVEADSDQPSIRAVVVVSCQLS